MHSSSGDRVAAANAPPALLPFPSLAALCASASAAWPPAASLPAIAPPVASALPAVVACACEPPAGATGCSAMLPAAVLGLQLRACGFSCPFVGAGCLTAAPGAAEAAACCEWRDR